MLLLLQVEVLKETSFTRVNKPNLLQMQGVQFPTNHEGDWSKATILQQTVINVNGRPTNIDFSAEDQPIRFLFNLNTGEGHVESTTKVVVVQPAHVQGPEQEILK